MSEKRIRRVNRHHAPDSNISSDFKKSMADYKRWELEAKECEEVYPDFFLFGEKNDPNTGDEFLKLIQQGIHVQTAYETVHNINVVDNFDKDDVSKFASTEPINNENDIVEKKRFGIRSIASSLAERVGAPIAFILMYLFGLSYVILPVVIFDLPFWIAFILAIVYFSGGIIADILMYAIWIWAIVIAVQQPIDTISIISFVVFVFFVIPQLLSFIRTVFYTIIQILSKT